MNQMPVPIWVVESYGAYRVMDASGLLCGHRLTQVSMCMAEPRFQTIQIFPFLGVADMLAPSLLLPLSLHSSPMLYSLSLLILYILQFPD